MRDAIAKWGTPAPVGVGEVAERYRNAIASACEGWTMTDGLRKHLESALWNPPAPQPNVFYEAVNDMDGLYQSAPQPAPAPLSDVVKDAARWRMVALISNELRLGPEKSTHTSVVYAFMDATDNGLDLTAAIDAALAAQGENT